MDKKNILSTLGAIGVGTLLSTASPTHFDTIKDKESNEKTIQTQSSDQYKKCLLNVLYGDKSITQQEKQTFTDNDRAFVAAHKDNKKMMKKINFTPTTIEVNGVKFLRKMLQYEDAAKDIPGLERDTHVYQKNGREYFTADVVDAIIEKGKNVPAIADIEKALKALDGDYGLLCQLLDCPKTGFRKRDGSWTGEDNTYHIWLSDKNMRTGAPAYMVSLDKSGSWNWGNPSEARTIILLDK